MTQNEVTIIKDGKFHRATIKELNELCSFYYIYAAIVNSAFVFKIGQRRYA